MPSIVSFHRNVGHAVILIILFSFFYLATPVCRFIHLLSETTQTVSIISQTRDIVIDFFIISENSTEFSFSFYRDSSEQPQMFFSGFSIVCCFHSSFKPKYSRMPCLSDGKGCHFSKSTERTTFYLTYPLCCGIVEERYRAGSAAGGL